MAESLPPAGGFVDQDLKDLFNESIDQLIADLGRPLKLFFDPTASGCPNCFIAVDGSSNGIYTGVQNTFPLGQFNKPFPNGGTCPVCKGSHKILTEKSVTYTALRQWNPKDSEIAAAGASPKNIVRTKTQITSFEDLKKAKKALIDGQIVVRIRDPVPAGLTPPQFAKVFWQKQD